MAGGRTRGTNGIRRTRRSLEDGDPLAFTGLFPGSRRPVGHCLGTATRRIRARAFDRRRLFRSGGVGAMPKSKRSPMRDFAKNVASQALGTVLAAAVIYLGGVAI